MSLMLLLSSVPAVGREICGEVLSDVGERLSGAYCGMYSLPDSVWLRAAVTDEEGLFSIEEPETGDWILQVKYMGYSPTEMTGQEFISKAAIQDTVRIVMRSTDVMLEEVEVKARRPQLTVKGEAFSYNVDDILRTQSVTSAFDLMTKLPLLNSLDGNAITLSGAPMGSVVYVNGRQTQMSESQLVDYLKAIPGQQVKDVQIIYNPSPKWKTRSSVINVVLRQQNAYTLNGQLQFSDSYKYANSIKPSMALFAGLPKLNLRLMYNYDDSRSRQKEIQSIIHTVGDKQMAINDTAVGKSRFQSHNVHTAISYDINEKTNLELTYNGFFSPKINSAQHSSNSYTGLSYHNSVGHSNMNTVSLTGQTPIGITFGVDYLNYRLKNRQTLDSLDNTHDGILFNSRNSQSIDKLRAYIDGSNSLGKGWTVTYGGSYDFTRNRNTQNIHPFDAEASTSSKSTENIARLYVGGSRWLFNNRLWMSLSVTGEYYNMEDYTKYALFPNLTMTFIPGPDHIVQASFASYKNYPSFWERQDYISYNNRYQVSIGNPGLRPAVFNEGQLIYVLNNKYTAVVSYSKIRDFFFTQPFLSSEKFEQVRKVFNLDDYTCFEASVIVPFNVGAVWNSTITASITKDRFKTDDWHGLSFDRKKWVGRVIMQNTLRVCARPKISLDLSGLYRMPNIVGLLSRTSLWTVNAGGTVELMDGNLLLQLRANDIFETYMPIQKVSYGSQHMNVDSNFYGRSFSVSLSYKFRGYKEKAVNEIDTSRYGIE